MNLRIPVTKLEPLPFKIKTFGYNRYRIEHPKVSGILNLGHIVTRVSKVPDSMIPNQPLPDGIAVAVEYHPIMSFTNQGHKNAPSQKMPTPQELGTSKKQELTGFIIDAESYEPWNEYVLEKPVPRLLKTRTVLVKIEWVVDCYDRVGDPALVVKPNTIHSISNTDTPESGMR